jgi:prevent-host-death family protein
VSPLELTKQALARGGCGAQRTRSLTMAKWNCSTCTTQVDGMRAITARDANQSFSELLSSVEQGEEVVITKRGRPVAVLSPYQHPERTPEREAALARATALMEKGLPWGGYIPLFRRDDMHNRV